MNIYIDVKSLSTSLLTWRDYADMVQLAIKNDINNFIFSNDDTDYKFYAESRFKTFISNAKINLGISGTTIKFIKDKIDIHYAINPNYNIRLDKLLNAIEQQSITSAYVIWDENHIEESIEAIQKIKSFKDNKILKNIGLLTNNKNFESLLERKELKNKIDYFIIDDIELPDKRLIKGENILFSSTIYKDIFLLINLLYKSIPVLRTKLNENKHLKQLLQQFLNNYDINNLISDLKFANLQGIILQADNAELLKYIFTNNKNATNFVAEELIQELTKIKNNESEPWWSK